MSFMQETLAHSERIWEDCIRTPFVQEIKNCTLPITKFKEYMIQDSIYLKHYARIYGMAMYRAATLKEIQMFYAALSFVTDTESAVRLNYLRQFGMTDDDIESILPFEENQEYIDFMVGIAEQGDIREILMAILPCMLSYGYIFRRIACDPVSQKSRYKDLIGDYSTEQFEEFCNTWLSYADSLCDSLPAEKQENLSAIFEKGSMLELGFWKMAYRGTAHE